jgi:putative transposase
MALGKDERTWQAAYRDLFRVELDHAAISDIRLALNQNQQLGNSGFYANIEAMTGRRREPRPRGRPRKQQGEWTPPDAEQRELPI